MIEYAEQSQMVDSMRACSSGSCRGCMLEDYRFAEPRIECPGVLLSKAADMINRLYAKTQEQKALIDEQDEEIAELKDEIMRYPSEEAGT